VPGSFNNPQVNSDGTIEPDGPLADIPSGLKKVEVYGWVLTPCAFIKFEGEPNQTNTSWKMEQGSEEQRGKFASGEDGIAIGTITMVDQNDNVTVDWWTTTVHLR
jgi:hypothetical protein